MAPLLRFMKVSNRRIDLGSDIGIGNEYGLEVRLRQPSHDMRPVRGDENYYYDGVNGLVKNRRGE